MAAHVNTLETSKKKILFILFLIFSFGVIIEMFSFMFFNGLWYEMNPVCGSYCEVWPGIMTDEVCILICAARNGYYVHSFYIGLIFLALPIIFFIKLKTKKKR